MDVTIDNITMKRINLDVAEVKEAIMVYVASYMNPKLTITEIDKAEVYVRRDGTAQVEIIIDSVPDMPDIAPPCIETPGGAGPMHPEQIMKNLEQGFSKNQLADKED